MTAAAIEAATAADPDARPMTAFLDLGGSSCTDDCGGNLTSTKHPANRQLSQGYTIALGYGTQLINKLQRCGELRLLKIRVLSTVVIEGKSSETSSIEFAGKQPPLHRAVSDNADITLCTITQQFVFDFAMKHTIRRLKGSYRGDFPDAFELLDIKIRYAYVSHLTFFSQSGHRFPRLLNIFLRLRPVHLVQVYYVDAESFQACLTFSADTFRFETAYFFPFFVPQQTAFCGDDGSGFSLFERFAEQLFGMAATIYWCGINPVDSEVERFEDRSDCFIIVLRSPAELPRPTHRPGA